MKKRILSMLLVIVMVVGMLPSTVFAATADNLCEHHTEHTAECGYVEGVSDCAYHCDVCAGSDEKQGVAYAPTTTTIDGKVYYRIGTADDLFWFANHVNTVDRTANAILTADIDLGNEPWTPIGSTGENSNNFRGHFDGQGHTIEGLYVDAERAGVGFFGEVRTGTVENFTIYGEVVMDQENNYVGGVIGSACGLNSSDHGLERNGAIIRNITSYVNLTAGAHGIGMVGGFIGYANHQSLIENCAWYGTFDAGIYRVDSGAGGFVGKIQENSSEVTIRNCGAYGTIKTNYAGDYNNNATIYMGGFLSFSNTNAQTTLENCLFAGRFERGENLTDQAFLGAFGTLRSVNAIKNCYYLGDDGLAAVHSDSNLKPGSDNVEIISVSTAQLLSGEIAYLLQEANEVWGQDIGTDDYPVLGGETVYYGYDSCADDAAKVYTNVSERPSHSYTNGFCSACDSYEPAADSDSDGYYEISNAGQLYWFAAQVNGGNKAINGKLMENITVNENVLDANGELNSGSFRVWTPIGNEDKPYSGTFDGNGKTVSGLYYNNEAPGTANQNIGLFGLLNGAAVQDVSVSDSYLYGFQDVGGIAGVIAGSSTITGCTNSATVGGVNTAVGGIVGTVLDSSITDCTNTGSVSGDKNYVGGIAGGVSGSSIITGCTNSATVGGTGTSSQDVGGIAGYFGSGTVENCYNTGSVGDAHNKWVGGIAGYVGLSGIVNNCYNIGAVSGSSEVGGVVGYNLGGTVTNCYYLDTSCTEGLGTVKTTEAFASGEVAYLLGDAFGQTIGTEDHPVLGGAQVYRNNDCVGAIVGYSNTDTVIHGEFENGFCTNCGGFEPAELVDGVYEISNAGQLYWFAAQVNGGDNAINGKLMENITVNENVLTEMAKENPDTSGFRAWTPIGSRSNKYSGTFDGNGKTVSGLYFNDSTTNRVGLFGLVGQYGTVKNVGVVDSYLQSSYDCGGIVGYCNAGTIENCYNTGAVIGRYVGGVVGSSIYGTIRNCYNAGAVISNNDDDEVGGVVGNSSTGTVQNCYNIGSVSGNYFVGGVVGYNESGTVTNCYYLDTCGAEGKGTAKTAEAFASGEVAYLLGDAFGQTIGTEDHPVLGGAQVYCGYVSCADTEIGYTNNPNASETKPDHKHDPVTGKCANCDDIKLIEYDLLVGGAQVTSHNAADVFGDGKVSYDPEDNTLTLNNYTYEGAGYNDAAIYYGGGGTLKLVLVNDSTVTHAGSSDQSYGIYVEGGSITISGSGSLTVTADDTPSGQSMSCGIYVSSGDLTILGGTVTATGGKASDSYSADSDGICVQGTITISGGTVTAIGGEVSDGKTTGCSSIGLYAYGEIHISGGTVTAASGTVNGEYSADSIGVLAHSGLTLGEGIGILTPVGGSFDADKRAVVDAAGKIATEVKIAEMPDPVKVQLELTKEFNGWGKADGFTFNLAAVTENAPMPASPSATATEEKPLAYFGEITYTAEGTYEYTITEVDSGIPGVTYDTSAHEVVVTIENTEDNTLIAEVKYDGELSLIITNTYTEATRYPLWIGGTQVTSHNAADVFGDGTVSYDADSNTLTLNSYTYEGPGYTWDNGFGSPYGAAIYYGDTETLNLLLEGDSVVTHTGGRLYSSNGLYSNGNVVVDEGDDGGSLTITGGAAYNDSYGVRLAYGYDENYNLVGGELILNSGSLIATGGISQLTRIGIGARTIAVHGGSLIAKAMPLQEGEDPDIGRWGLACMYADDSITFADGFGIQTPVGGIVAMGSVYNSYEDAENYADPADYVEIGAGYTVTAAFAGVDGKDVGGTVSGAGFYRAGANVTLTITPNTGCELKSVTAASDGSTVNGTLSGSTYTFTMPENDVVVTVTMERLFTPYDLWVGGEQFTDKKLTVNGTTGTATYDPDSNTLTLDGYTYEGAGHTWEEAGWGGTPFYYGAAIYYSGTETLNLILKGDSSVTHTGSAEMSASYGLYVKGNVVVSEGSAGGSLVVTGGTAKFESHGVCLKVGLDENLMHVGGELTINSGSLTAIAGAAQQIYGVYANTSITVSGSLTATGGTAEYNSYGVYLMDHNGTITVSGSLHATGDNYGVYAYGSITVSGSLHATSNYYAVDANGITVSGSLTATGGESALCTASLTLGEGIGILTPVGGRYDEDSWHFHDADGNTATEVEIGIACDHSGNENQHTDCTVDLICSVCGEVVTEAAAAHIPGEDDGDCTTAIKCTVCGTVTTPAKEAHTPGADDGDCTTAVKCTVCDKNAVEAKTHSDGEDKNHACDNSGCTVDNVDGGHHGGTATCVAAAVCAECGQSYGALGGHTGELQWIQTPATHKQIYVCCGAVVVNEASHNWGEDNVCTICRYGCAHTYENPVFVWQADFSAAKMTVTCGSCEDVKELNCEISSQWDADTLTFTATAGEGAYTDTQTIQLAVVGGKLTITNSAAAEGETVEMIIMVAGHTGGRMTGCQVIEDVTGVIEQTIEVSGDTIKIFFLNPETYEPLFACAEL